MKIQYLSTEDRKNLRELKKLEDLEEIAGILKKVLCGNYTLQSLWEYRMWFLMLTEELLKEAPVLAYGLAQIYIMQGELERAEQIIDKMPKDSNYQFAAQLMLPGIDEEEIRWLNEKICSDKELVIHHALLTAGRTSVINGIWDLTPYSRRLQVYRDEILPLFEVVFQENADCIFDIMCAEALYQKDECYDALVLVVSKLPFLKSRQDMRLLFVALTLEIFILVINGQVSSAQPLIENLRQQMISNKLEAYLPNIDALDAWAAMYDGDYVRLTNWMRNDAPEEYGQFCMLDLFRYMMKMRGYIIQGKHFAVTSLANRLIPLLKKGKRYMDTCEIYMILAMSDYADGRKEEAFMHIEKALALAEHFRYDRLLADEAKPMHTLLLDYRKQHGESLYLNRIIKLTEKTALLHPRYLKRQLSEQPALTEAEMRVLRLMADNRTNREIAQILSVALDTVKHHCKRINSKLEVKNRHQAVQRAVELGIIEPSR